MIDVGAKPVTERMARASGRIRMRAETLQLILDRALAKGDVLEVARLAGIMALSCYLPLADTLAAPHGRDNRR